MIVISNAVSNSDWLMLDSNEKATAHLNMTYRGYMYFSIYLKGFGWF